MRSRESIFFFFFFHTNRAYAHRRASRAVLGQLPWKIAALYRIAVLSRLHLERVAKIYDQRTLKNISRNYVVVVNSGAK